jgi:hypothetical protein
VVVLIAGLLTVADSLRHEPREVAGSASSPTPPPVASTGPPAVALRTGPVSVQATGFFSWALLDRRTNTITGSPNLAEANDTASMIKAWIAADYLRRAAEQGMTPGPNRMTQLSIMIRDSDNAAAEAIHELNGGAASIERLIQTCGLTDSSPYRSWWSNTMVSARDTVRMGACIADGRAAGPKWTEWLLGEMRQVRGAGNFGFRAALPTDQAAGIAIKNGWLLRTEDRLYRVNCLAIGDGWVLGVLNRYPGSLGFEHGAALCRTVGEQLMS